MAGRGIVSEIRISLTKAEAVALGYMHAEFRRKDFDRPEFAGPSLDWPSGCIKSQARLSGEAKVLGAIADAFREVERSAGESEDWA
jgi:hypothetical protein